MEAEIIAVGSELLTSQRVDTNSLFLTDQLNTLGVEVRRKMVVGDDRELLTASIREALARVEIVILTGGLGPTEDDLTRDAAAAATGRKLVFRDDLRDAIAERFRRMNRKMAEINLRQAYAVEGAEALDNPNGTAAGQYLEHKNRIVMLLPGPPHEMKPMFTNHCVPRLALRLPAQVIRTRFYRVAGMGESDLDQLIAPVYTKYLNPVTTILAAPSDIQIHLRARCSTAEEAEALLAEVGPPIEALLGDRIYSRNGESLEATVGAMLAERSATVSVAESCTGGLLGQRLTSIAGSSKYFVGGFLVYNDFTKELLLQSQVPEDKLHICPNHIDTSRFQPQYSGGDYVLYLGGLYRDKGVMTIAKAFTHLPDIQLKLVGAGSEEQELRDYIQQHQLSNMEILGYKSGDEKLELLRNSKFTVVASQLTEPFGLV
ncbi:MAG: CinA family nicotinamide mononucleotide deamidase-related protein, partial [Bryobacteraceae bacterium]